MPASPNPFRRALSLTAHCGAWFTAGMLLQGCGREVPHPPDSGHRATDFPTNVIAYQVKGVLKEIRANGAKALIEHEDIPGYMEAMTMLLDVKQTNELRGLSPGDPIRFRMLVTDSDGWIDRLERIATSGTLFPASNRVAITPSERESAGEAVRELFWGDPLPDCTLTNQMGQRIRLSDFKGQALAFTFIFTRCPFPTYCPRMNNNFSTAQNLLAKSGAGTNWQFISISFDPEWDTPARLAKYAEAYHYDPAHWSFATGNAESIRKLGDSFGLMYNRAGGSIEHNVRTVVIDAGGVVQRIFTGNEWQPEELFAEMSKALKAKP